MNVGDQLRFTFKGANGETLVAELTVTDEMLDTADIQNTTKNLFSI